MTDTSNSQTNDVEAGLLDLLGGIDVYLLDQVMKGRLGPGSSVLDAGCGYGRNLRYFLRAGYDVWALDKNADAVADVRQMAARLAPDLPSTRFRVGLVEEADDLVPPGSMDLVTSNAVLHFADGHAHFRAMLDSMWRSVRPGGLLFTRMTSTLGLSGDNCPQPVDNEGHYQLGDGSVRYLIGLDDALRLAEELGGRLIEPFKSVNVQNLRSMCTWVMQKAR